MAVSRCRFPARTLRGAYHRASAAHRRCCSNTAGGEGGLATGSSSPDARRCRLIEPPGLVPYTTAREWQLQLRAERMACAREKRAPLDDALLLLQHSPVYTLGRGATEEHLRFDPDHAARLGLELHRVERGGEVTYHGPGQLVGYPILDLRRHRQDLHWYVRQVEEVVIRTLGRCGIDGAARDEEHTGVWVGDRKVAAVGIAVSRWVTMHGFSINVTPDLAAFGRIVPCGIEDRGVTSVQQLLDEGAGKRCQSGVGEVQTVAVESIQALAREAVAEVFELDMLPSESAQEQQPASVTK